MAVSLLAAASAALLAPAAVMADADADRAHEIAEMQAEEAKFHKEHEGHEAMHAEMILILFAVLILSQFVLVFWKRNHFQSYQKVTLFGMWLIPIYFSLENLWWRMLISWGLFSVCTAYVTWRATRKPLPQSTPRFVYWYFFVLYKITGFVGMAGYVIALLDFVLGPYLPRVTDETLMMFGIMTMFYGLYYGVLVRDFADICAEFMATSIGFFSKDGIPALAPNSALCALCCHSLSEMEQTGEKTHTLTCGHSFHEFCIRGWSIVGKKQTCPYCKERVDLKRMFPTHWARGDMLYSQLLDGLRYLVVWYPVIITLVQGIIWALGLK